MLRPMIALTVCTAGLVAGCGAQPKPTPAASTAKPVHVTKVRMSNYKYTPAKVELKKDTVVEFSTNDTAAHTATSKGSGDFDSGDVTKGNPVKVTFSTPGTFAFQCTYHPRMKGTVKVDP